MEKSDKVQVISFRPGNEEEKKASSSEINEINNNSI